MSAVLALFAACGGSGEDDAGSSGGRATRSVVLLILDTLRADRLSCYGGPDAASPELDALAGQGVLFEHVIAQSPWTRPSVVVRLVGQYDTGSKAIFLVLF